MSDAQRTSEPSETKVKDPGFGQRSPGGGSSGVPKVNLGQSGDLRKPLTPLERLLTFALLLSQISGYALVFAYGVDVGGEGEADMPASNATNATSTTADGGDGLRPEGFFIAGVMLSVVADVIIAVSLGIQKHAHNSNTGDDGEPIKPYVFLPLWWYGIVLNVSGEVGNMLAYGLAPAAVVAPVGSVGVVVNAIISFVFLGEPLRRLDVVGLVGVISGVVMVIWSVPEKTMLLTVEVMTSSAVFGSRRALIYLAAVAGLLLLFVCHLERRYARKHLLVRIGDLLAAVLSLLSR